MIRKEQFNIGTDGMQGGGGNPFASPPRPANRHIHKLPLSGLGSGSAKLLISTSYIISLQPPPILNTSLASSFSTMLYNIDRKEGDFMLCIILVGLVTVLVTAKVGIPLLLCLKELNKEND